jgi:hypothetical protein
MTDWVIKPPVGLELLHYAGYRVVYEASLLYYATSPSGRTVYEGNSPDDAWTACYRDSRTVQFNPPSETKS